MNITKYEHACLTIEQDGRLIIIDPGEFTSSLAIPTNVDAIVITHEHQDHFDPNMLAAIYDKNPTSLLISLSSIVEKMPDHQSHAVAPGDAVNVGPFTLEFFGGSHAEIHHTIARINNLSVLVNDTFYYPGDSFALPQRDVKLLALPASGPWFKTSDAVDFLLSVKPHMVFPVHDIHNSSHGQALFDRIVGGFATNNHITYTPLSIGQTVDI